MHIEYIEKNKELWNARTAYHVDSDFYDMESFLRGESSLDEIVINLLGDVKGLSILHLQCHFGQDSLSMARMGAKVTGVDLSDKSIDMARELNEKLNLDAEFICCDLYSLPELLDKQFDIVFTSYGTIGWLPDIDKWAKVVSKFLKPGGKFVFAEFHPVVWMFDNDFDKVAYNYFNVEPIIETEHGTYADKDANLHLEYIGWNHHLGEVITGLLKNGLTIVAFEEFDYSPYNCFRHTEEVSPKKYRIKHMGNKIPMVFSILGVKN